MELKQLVKDPDSWYDAFEEKSITEQYDFLMETFQEELPDDFEEQTELVMLLIDVVGHFYEKEKEFEKALLLIEAWAKAMPKVYQKDFQYFDHQILDYYMFLDDPGKVIPLVDLYREFPNGIDQMLPFHKQLWYWGLRKEAVTLAKEVFHPVDKNPKFLSGAGYDFAIAVLYDHLQEIYEQSLESGKVDFLNHKALAKEYGFELEEKYFENYKDDFLNDLDKDLFFTSFEKNGDDWFPTLKLHFLKYMHQRKFSFHTAYLIWVGLAEFWEGRIKNKKKLTENYFQLPDNKFDEFLGGMKELFYLEMKEVFKTLWGAQFVYDFLLEYEIISKDLFFAATRTINDFKKTISHSFGTRLWECSFTHKAWPKADSVQQAVFDEELKIIEQSFRTKSNPTNNLDLSSTFVDLFPEIIKLKPKPGHKVQDYEKQPRAERNPEKKQYRKLKKKKKRKRK